MHMEDSRNPYTAINSLFTNASRLMSCASASHHNHLVQPKVREECRCLGHHHFVFIEVLKQVTQVFQSFCTQNCKSTIIRLQPRLRRTYPAHSSYNDIRLYISASCVVRFGEQGRFNLKLLELKWLRKLNRD